MRYSPASRVALVRTSLESNMAGESQTNVYDLVLYATENSYIDPDDFRTIMACMLRNEDAKAQLSRYGREGSEKFTALIDKHLQKDADDD